MKLWPEGGLWRRSDFLKLWSAETVSQFGTQISQLALPLAAIDVLHASAFEVAALTTVEFLPFLLVSLPAGVWVDRLPRRPILIVGDLARAALLASVPIAYFFDALTIWHLFAVGFLVGIATVFFDIAYQSYLPALVERQEIIDGNAKLEISRSAAQTGGPGFAGVLIGLLKAPPAILIDAISFLASGLFILGIRKTGDVPQRPLAATQDARRAAGRPQLCPASPVPEEHRRVHGPLQLLRVGGVRRSARVRPPGTAPGPAGDRSCVHDRQPRGDAGGVHRQPDLGRLGVGRTIILASVVGGPSFLLVPFAPHGQAALLVIVPALIVGSFTNVVYNIAQVSLRQAITPERIQGRMNSVMRFIVWGTIPLGSITGGAVASLIGLKETLIIGGLGCCLPFLTVLFSPVRAIHEMPEPLEDEPLDVILADAEAATVPPSHV